MPASGRSPSRLSEPWRGYATNAQHAKERFDQVVAGISAGPLRDRLKGLSARLDDGIAESWRIARRGDEIVRAIGQIDTATAGAELATLRQSRRRPDDGRSRDGESPRGTARLGRATLAARRGEP